MRIWPLIPVLCALLGLQACSYTAMPHLRSTVLDASSGQPVAAARITAYGRDGVIQHATTDADGRFTLDGALHYGPMPFRMLPQIRVVICADGYQPYDETSAYSSYSERPTVALPYELQRAPAASGLPSSALDSTPCRVSAPTGK
jgi:hypothetical protein